MSDLSSAKPSSPLFLITHEFYPVSGGIATFAEEIARASAILGYDVEVWAQSASPAVEKDWPFRMRRLPLKGTHDLICQFKLACELVASRRQLRNATVYLPEPGPMLTMMLLQFFKAFRPKRLVLTFHGTEILRFARSPIRRWLSLIHISFPRRTGATTWAGRSSRHSRRSQNPAERRDGMRPERQADGLVVRHLRREPHQLVDQYRRVLLVAEPQEVVPHPDVGVRIREPGADDPVKVLAPLDLVRGGAVSQVFPGELLLGCLLYTSRCV